MEKPVMHQWAIYDKPRDYPVGFVVRRWDIYPDKKEPVPGPARMAWSLEQAQSLIPNRDALVRIVAGQNDDPTLVETWI